ncbi:MAG: hypothetical protein CVV47_01780 [Spirochaetae bacterium HGW-Spirochaetae-3]|jgi:tetratricopeptide (TPR) repeat protein|nr:MAG: hypothetical protein CVV47_01780 [Spirochaetae bacterium HGW-Spirochaetae-3]
MSSKEIGAKAAAQASASNDVTFNERLNDFMHANRKLFLVIGIAAVVAVVGFGIASMVTSSIDAKSAVALEQLENNYEAWNALEAGERTGKGAALLAEAEAVASKYGRRYASARAATIKAQVLYADNDLPGAEKAYALIADSYPKSHLAPVALANAAAIAEDRGDTDAAIAYLVKSESEYPAAPGVGRITLSIGRIYETTKRYDQAMEAYTRLVATGAESDWTKIAHDRIILLKSQGLAR